MTETSSSAPPGAPRTGRRWLLVASLALNLLFIGGIAGLWLKGPHGPHGPPSWGPSPTAFGLMMFARQLPPERRDVVRVPLREARKTLRPLRAQLREARGKAAAVLASPDYTQEQLQAAMAAIADVDSRMRQAGTEALLAAIDKLTPDERRQLSEAWSKRLAMEASRRMRRGKDEGPDGPREPPSEEPR